MKTIGFNWTAESDDGVFRENSSKAFATQQACYEDMMNHAIDKMKWNVEWEDFDECEPSKRSDGIVSAKVPIEHKLEVNTDKITHTSYSGTYYYEIEPIVVSDEEAKRMEAVRNWITRKDGYDGGILELTNNYTKCNDIGAWESVVQYWECNVPACPSEVPEDLDDAVLNMHLQIQKVADETNRRIRQYVFEPTASKIAAVYNIDGENRLYYYDLDDRNDLDHYFDNEESIIATYVLTRDDSSEEPVFYKEMPVSTVTKMVMDAGKRLEQRQMETT